jgi:hypothetical protein
VSSPSVDSLAHRPAVCHGAPAPFQVFAGLSQTFSGRPVITTLSRRVCVAARRHLRQSKQVAAVTESTYILVYMYIIVSYVVITT